MENSLKDSSLPIFEFLTALMSLLNIFFSLKKIYLSRVENGEISVARVLENVTQIVEIDTRLKRKENIIAVQNLA